MAQSLAKFFFTWFGVFVVLGAALFFTSGSPSSLNPAIEQARQAACDSNGGGFSGNQAQECLVQVERTLAAMALEARSSLMYWHLLSAVAVLILGLLFMVQLNSRSATASTPADFRSMRGTWLGYVLAIGAIMLVFGILGHIGTFFGAWATILSPARGWGVPALMVLIWCATFWAGTRSAAPAKMKPSIPGA